MKFCIATVSLLLVISPIYGQSFLKNENNKTTVFFTKRDTMGKYAYIKGRVLLFTAKRDASPGDLLDKVEDRTEASVRLYNNEAVHEGDILYIIDDKNLVNAKLHVTRVFRSNPFGFLLSGYGNFRLASINDRVVQLKEDSYSKKGGIYKSRGDYYLNVGNPAKAIVEYKKALEQDKGNPEVHLELGYLYLKQGLLPFASREFKEGYARKNRIYDRWDRFRLLKGIVEVRYREIYETALPRDMRGRYLDEGIRICDEALKLYPDSIDIHYYLGVFYYRNPAPEDAKARDHLQKVTELNPDDEKAVKANIILSRLYLKHKNAEKAKSFAMRAIATDPYNRNARDILKVIEDSSRKGFIK
ncbi:MAG: tetratricopeptide repeat protein [Spirochaetes bacterium]|nr:tetratricopeptide repeat protein [Spirochaetota bacterium]